MDQISRYRQLRKTCGGQAIAELAVCLIVMLVLMLGVLLISALTQVNVTNAIASRTETDRHLRSGSGKGSAVYIERWSYGGNPQIKGFEKGIPFTADDKPVTGGGAAGQIYLDQLHAMHPDEDGGSMDVRTMGGNSTGYLPDGYNQPRVVANFSGDLFLNAANLRGGSSEVTDPLAEKSFKSLKEAYKNLFGFQSARVEDTTYLPAKPEVALPESATGK